MISDEQRRIYNQLKQAMEDERPIWVDLTRARENEAILQVELDKRERGSCPDGEERIDPSKMGRDDLILALGRAVELRIQLGLRLSDIFSEQRRCRQQLYDLGTSYEELTRTPEIYLKERL